MSKQTKFKKKDVLIKPFVSPVVVVVVHTFNPCRQAGLCEFQVSQVTEPVPKQPELLRETLS